MISIDLLNKVSEQVDRVEGKYGSYVSLHEAYGVLIEEIRELETEIFKKHRDFDRVEAETIDCITVLVRLYEFAKTRNDR